LVCSPALYFNFGEEAQFVDIGSSLPVADAYIFGGGAMFRRLRRLDVPGVKIAWGVGQTNRRARETKGVVPDGFALFGSRDVGQQGAEWVPCASCMSDLFDRSYDTKHEVVGYWNFELGNTTPQQPKVEGIVSATNRCSFEDAIRFLGSGKRIITNSYHGAYWGTLLKREVVIINAYSSKFFGFKHQPSVTDVEAWQSIRKPRVFDDALEECRDATLRFCVKVQDAIWN
jgi:hypothetical protein